MSMVWIILERKTLNRQEIPGPTHTRMGTICTDTLIKTRNGDRGVIKSH